MRKSVSPQGHGGTETDKRFLMNWTAKARRVPLRGMGGLNRTSERQRHREEALQSLSRGFARGSDPATDMRLDRFGLMEVLAMTWVRSAWLVALGCVGGMVSAQDAKPYFQQEVAYAIDVELDDVRHELRASTIITYTNRSSTALDTLWFHVYPNAYKRRGTALSEQQALHGDLDLWFAENKDRGFMDSLDFRTGGQPVQWGLHPQHIDIAWLKLANALQPNTSVTITTPFRVKIPDARFSRLGHTGQAYYITQWYPKPAVFDNAGWHAMPYLDQGEFFSDFGSFDVRITLPQNYVVGATGELQNEDEKQWLEGLAANNRGEKGPNNFPLTAPNTKTLHYVQDSVLDFAWFADKRYMVEKSNVVLPSGRSVETWVMYTPRNTPTWYGSVEFVNQAVLQYSKWVGEYPFNVCTAVDGTISAGGGMEYPMITIIGESGSKEALDEVIAHEVGHNWFQGILASNERDHPWMDEGMNSFVELRYMRARYPNHKSVVADGIPEFLFNGRTVSHREVQELAYRLNARRNLDQSCSLHSEEYTSTNYGTSVYMKTALVFDHLFAYLGDSLFDACVHEYYRRWAFKHPKPEDVQKVFEGVSGRDLSWCFARELGTDVKDDAKAIRLRGDRLRTRPKYNQQHMPVTGWSKADSLGTTTLPPFTQEMAGFICGNGSRNRAKGWPLPWSNATRVTIDADHRTLDIDHRNNTVRSKGILRSWTPVRLKWLAGLEHPEKRTLYWTPIIAGTVHDGFQAGLALYNTVFPSQRTEFVFAPLYATGSQRLVGSARIEHHFDRLRSSWFRNIHVGVSGRTAGLRESDNLDIWYEKASPSIRFDIKRPLAKPTQHSFGGRVVYVRRSFETTSENIPGSYLLRDDQWISELGYDGKHTHPLGPAAWNATLTQGTEWMRASVEVEKAFVYDKRKHSVRLRLFAGSFFGEPTNLQAGEAWRQSWNADDPFLDRAFIGRGEDAGLWANQFSKDQGAFKTGFLQGGSASYIGAVNFECDLPVRFPIAVFASAGVVPVVINANGNINEKGELLYEAGIGLPLWKDMIEIWMPLVLSSNIGDELEFRNVPVVERIRFVLALEKMDPTRIVRNLRP